ncbi:hypothetical protein AB4493_18085, partial [Vibrio sp. 10N.222.55.A1]
SAIPPCANHRVSLHANPDKIFIIAEWQFVAEQQRVFKSKHETTHIIYDWGYYLLVVQREPGSLRNFVSSIYCHTVLNTYSLSCCKETAEIKK